MRPSISTATFMLTAATLLVTIQGENLDYESKRQKVKAVYRHHSKRRRRKLTDNVFAIAPTQPSSAEQSALWRTSGGKKKGGSNQENNNNSNNNNGGGGLPSPVMPPSPWTSPDQPVQQPSKSDSDSNGSGNPNLPTIAVQNPTWPTINDDDDTKIDPSVPDSGMPTNFRTSVPTPRPTTFMSPNYSASNSPSSRTPSMVGDGLEPSFVPTTFVLDPASSASPTHTPSPTITGNPTGTLKPTSVIDQLLSLDPTATAIPTTTKQPTIAPSITSKPTQTPYPTTTITTEPTPTRLVTIPPAPPTTSPTKRGNDNNNGCQASESGDFGVPIGDAVALKYFYTMETTTAISTDDDAQSIAVLLEQDISNVMLPTLFSNASACAGAQVVANKARMFIQNNENRDNNDRKLQRRRLEVVGISSKPTDNVLSGVDCPSKLNPDDNCYVVAGEVTIYSERGTDVRDTIAEAEEDLEEAASTGKFDNITDNVARIRIIDSASVPGIGGNDPDTIGGDNSDPLPSWLVAGLSIAGGLFGMLICLRLFKFCCCFGDDDSSVMSESYVSGHHVHHHGDGFDDEGDY